jgi:hypothetical protein
MGYTIKIGNAKPVFSKEDFPYLSANWEVEDIELPEAPAFPNDINNHKNERWPSYTVWDNFCKEVGLYKLFYGKYRRDEYGNEVEYDGLFTKSSHPGCIGITKEDADFVTEALNKYKENATLPPGFEGDEHWHDCDKAGCKPNYDYQLARLIWLEWWMQWAVKNCETPAIENS